MFKSIFAIKDKSYYKACENLDELKVDWEAAKYLVNTAYFLLNFNYIAGFPNTLKKNIKSALEKKLSGEEARIHVEKDILIYDKNY